MAPSSSSSLVLLLTLAASSSSLMISSTSSVAARAVVSLFSRRRWVPPTGLVSSRQSSSSSSLVNTKYPAFSTKEGLLRRPHYANWGASRCLAVASPEGHRSDNSNRRDDAQGRRPPPHADTGGLRRLPVVKSTKELSDKAIRTSRSVRADSNLKNARARTRKHASMTLDALTQSLCVPLRDVVKGYKAVLRTLHPFERVVADLTARSRQKKDGVTLSTVLEDLHEARKEILLASKDWIARAKNAETARESSDAMKEGEERLVELFHNLAGQPLNQIVSLQKALRTAPVVRLDSPAVVLVGAPNVGKSSIVRQISSGTPEVNNYPFTTRGVTLGHVEVFWEEDTGSGDGEGVRAVGGPARAVVPRDKDARKGRLSTDADSVVQSYAFSQLCQVMDSPGLLARPDGERNEMESLTLAALQHLPTAVMYVMDLSGGAGDRCSSVEDQLLLRKEVRSRFPRRPWVDVLSKSDLGVLPSARSELENILAGETNAVPYLEVSVQDNIGVDELRREVLRMLGEVRVVLDAMAAVDERAARPSSAT